MNRRTFTIPSLGTLSLTLSTACSGPDSIIGSWDLSEVRYDGEVYQMTYSFTYYDCSFTYSFGVEMNFEENDGGTYDGKWNISLLYSVQCSPSSPYFEKFSSYTPYNYTYSYGVTAQSDNRRNYTIKLKSSNLSLSCVRDRDELTCNDTNDEEVEYLFER